MIRHRSPAATVVAASAPDAVKERAAVHRRRTAENAAFAAKGVIKPSFRHLLGSSGPRVCA
ncbi:MULTISPECIES: hypothetical protein [Streptomyces]|uniref:hypothetical protein n=1 Tax=Streptomyces TaxID=1883 RepID=UPI0012FF3F94|nr:MULTISPECIES: hypothetical protein [Streptomyces]